MRIHDFLQAIIALKLTNTQRAIAVMWYITKSDTVAYIPFKHICKKIESAGFAKQNVTTLKRSLIKDRRVLKNRNDEFKINPKYQAELDLIFSQYLNIKTIPKLDSFMMEDLFKKSRSYILKVVKQINASYFNGLYDCCAVMCRRLMETLIIESYEHHNISTELKDSEGHYLFFSGLLFKIQSNNKLSISRNTITALKNFKKLGDLSSHNRRYNARKPDLEKVQQDIRVASEELLILSNQAP